MTLVRCDPKPSQSTLITTYLVTGCSYKVDSRDDDKYRQLHLLQLSLESHTFVIVIIHRASESLCWGKMLTQTRSSIDWDASWHDPAIEVISFRMKATEGLFHST